VGDGTAVILERAIKGVVCAQTWHCYIIDHDIIAKDSVVELGRGERGGVGTASS